VEVDQLPQLQAALSGRYTIVRELGRGGMATVYLARDVRHDRLIALKVVRPDLAAVLGPVRFLREIGIAAGLTHPHILPLYDSGEAAGWLYYVMPYIEGETLRDRLNRERQLPVADALEITRQVADAMAYAHSRNVVHRDVKPENILLQGVQAFVADFGIAKAISAARGDTISEPGLAVGTPAYMSPEQAEGSVELDGRADIYSLGCVLYEMLAGEPPHTGATAHAIMARQQSETPRPLRVLRPTIPPAVEQAVFTALEKVPADRYPTASQFAEALSRPDAALARTRRGKTPRARLLAVVLGVVVGGLAWFAWRRYAGAPSSFALGVNPTDIAVLYFEDRSEAGRLRHVASGLTEDLIDELSKVPTLHVISPNGVRPYVDHRIPPDSIARVLRVGTLVGGSLESSVNGLRLTVRLIDAATGVQLQSRTLERPMGDLFSLERDLAEEVSQFLRERLGQQIQVQERRTGTGSVEAWERTREAEQLREEARTLNAQGDTSAAQRALGRVDSLLRLASRLDPKWPDPILLLGWTAVDQIELYETAMPDTVLTPIRDGLRQAERALALRPGYPPALELRGTLLYERWKAMASDTSEIVAAERDLRAAAVPENPSQARAWGTLSAVLQARGRLAEASLAAQKAYEVDAFLTDSPKILFRLYHTSLDLGRGDEAIKWCETGRRRFPERWDFSFCELTILLWPGLVAPDVPRAWQLVSDLERMSTPEERAAYRARWQMMAAGVLERAGLADSAEAVMQRARAAAPDDPDMDFHEATARVLRGQRDEAARLLGRFLAARPQFRSYIRVDPVFRPLQDDPRFRALIEGAGTPNPP
jgi:serine/threonine-protein kinase